MALCKKKPKGRWGKRFVDKRDWKAYNEELVVRGTFYMEMEWTKSWDKELKRMNKGKRGAPYEFPESLIKLQAVWNQWVDYRGIEGITRKLAEYGLLPAYNDYTTAYRRVNRLDTEFKLPEDRDVNVTSDGTGMRMTNGGSHRERRYGRKRKKYIKVVITADPIRRKLLDCEVSIEGEGESEPETALKHVRRLKKKGKKIKKFWGDSGLDERDLINELAEDGTEMAIKPRRLDISDAPESAERKKLVEDFNKLGYKKWARKRKYGIRWVGTEGIFSAVKRKFGENVRSLKPENMLKEVKRRFWVYDMLQQYANV